MTTVQAPTEQILLPSILRHTPEALGKKGAISFSILKRVANTPFKPERDNKKIWFQEKSFACLTVLELKDSQQSQLRPTQRTKVNTYPMRSWLLGRWLWNPRSQLKLGESARWRLGGNWRQSTAPNHIPTELAQENSGLDLLPDLIS